MSESSKVYQFSISGNTVTAVYEVKHGRVEFERMDNDETWSFDGVNVIKTQWDDGRQKVTTYTDYDGDGLYSKTGKSYTGGSFSTGETNAYDHDNHDDNDYDLDGSDDLDSDHGTGTYGFISVSDDSSYSLDTDDTFQNDSDLDDHSGLFFQPSEEFRFTLSNGSLATGNLASESDSIARMMDLDRWGWKTDYLNYNETLQVVNTGSDNLIVKIQTQWNGGLEFSAYSDDNNDGIWSEIAEGSAHETHMSTDGQIDLLGMANAGLLQINYAFAQ